MRTVKEGVALLIAVVLYASAFVRLSQASRGPQHEDYLTQKVDISLPNSVTVTYAFLTVLSAKRIPGGIVTISNCDEEPKHLLTQRSTSLRGALDSIASLDSLNRWQLEDGVVNLLPIHPEPPLLNLRILSFHTKNATTLFDALGQLLKLRVVRKRMAELNVSEIKTEPGLADLKRPGSKSDEEDQELRVQCKNATLREALNAIVRAHGYAVWAYSERHCDGRSEVRIDFIAR